MDNSNNPIAYEAYVLTCKPTKLQYVGIAKKFKNDGKSHGYIGRWKSHIKHAFSPKHKSYNYEICKVIREHGPLNFDVQLICETTDRDVTEMHYIKNYNTLHPNGYNMTEGGTYGKHSELANQKKRVERRDFSDESKQNMRDGQLGKRYTHEVERKHSEDQVLPKHVFAIRKNNEIIGYQVKKFPIGVDKKEYVYKTFKNINNLEEAFDDTIAYIADLTIEYQNRLNIKKQEQASTSQAKELKLPNNIYPKDPGYFVKGLKDYGEQDIPRQDFDTLEAAQEFIVKVTEFNEAKKLPFNWELIDKSATQIDELIPKFIEKSTYAKQHNGYIVQHITGYDDKSKPIKIMQRFTDRSKSIEDKYQEAITYIKETISGS